MKERPILFSAPMVRAILEGRKTMTRRVCKPAEAAALSFVVDCDDGKWGDEEGDVLFRCPYGQPGDRLWVRETWAVQRAEPCLPHERDWQELLSPTIRYQADCATQRIQGDRSTGMGIYRGPVERERPSIHMPRWASRITLEVTGVRVERLQDVSEADARSEGIQQCEGGAMDYLAHDYAQGYSSVASFRSLWESINGAGSWGANPWVWCVSFKRLEGVE